MTVHAVIATAPTKAFLRMAEGNEGDEKSESEVLDESESELDEESELVPL